MKLWFVLTVSLFACGGTQGEGPKGPSGGNMPAAAGDVSLEIPVSEIKNVVFEPPGALVRPGMPLASPKDKRTLEEQKGFYQKEKDVVGKQVQALFLATMLYKESKKQTGPAQKQLLEAARATLRDVQTFAKDEVDELTLSTLGCYEIQLEDWAAAERAWETLVGMTPKGENLLYNKAWWGYALLKQYKNAAALDLLKGDTVSEKQPEHAYVTGWAKWRMNDNAGARAAIATAYAGWGTLAYLRDQVWPTVVQFLIVDEHVEVTKRKFEAGYLLFELRNDGKTFHGSLEVMTVVRDGRSLVRFVLQIEDRPKWLEFAMLEQLETKLRTEFGSGSR